MSSLVLLLCLLQAPQGNAIPTQFQERVRELRAMSIVVRPGEIANLRAERQKSDYQEQEFIGRFNRLVETLVDFAEQYNTGRTIDAKKVKALKKAWRDLEKNDPWFKKAATGE